MKAITAEECLAAIAVFRLMMPAAHIFVMGGREVNLGASQHLIFRAGANGTMVGNYLTSAGRGPGETVEMVEGQGLRLQGAGHRARGRSTGPARDAEWNRRAVEPGPTRGLKVFEPPRAAARRPMARAPLDWIDRELDALGAKGLRRALEPMASPQGPEVEVGGRRLVNLCSNDYLGLAADPRLRRAAADA